MTKKKGAKQKAVEEILLALEDLGAHVHYRATTGSIYVKFSDERIGSLRISDHPGIPKYRYRWNLTAGPTQEVVDRGVRRFFYNFQDRHYLVRHIRRYAIVVENNTEQAEE